MSRIDHAGPRTRAAIDDEMMRSQDKKSNWERLFGTPERAARTLYCDKVPLCSGCALLDECERAPDEEFDTCLLTDYDTLLGWLKKGAK